MSEFCFKFLLEILIKKFLFLRSTPDITSSNQSGTSSMAAEYLRSVSDVDFFNVEPLIHICSMENSTKLYRFVV